MKSFLVDQDGYYGEFGGAYVPEILHKCVEELKNTYLGVLESEDFKKEFDQLERKMNGDIYEKPGKGGQEDIDIWAFSETQ